MKIDEDVLVYIVRVFIAVLFMLGTAVVMAAGIVGLWRLLYYFMIG